ncbi:hypothetical protein R1flu_000232 [Riccia fluitans]|uniref:Uncharacterized protein n=1 Tax=Riccia fluitans TaxID=41844 RepID=A0ABD1Y301_9MARC
MRAAADLHEFHLAGLLDQGLSSLRGLIGPRKSEHLVIAHNRKSLSRLQRKAFEGKGGSTEADSPLGLHA